MKPAISSPRLSAERGFTLPLFALLIAVFIGISALVIDHSKEELAVQNLQRSADATALAAVRQLNGRIDGWWDSKKAAVVAFRANPIHGASAKDISKIALSNGKSAYWDNVEALDASLKQSISKSDAPPQENSGIQGDANRLHVRVERGLYWRDPDSQGRFKFVSLEEDDDGLKGAVPYYVVANAVRVTVTLDRLDTFFGGIFGMNVFENLNRQAIAVMDHTLDLPVAPIGIPLCQLLFNTNPNQLQGSHFTPKYDSAMQCERATFVAETNAKGDLATTLDLSQNDQNPQVITASERTDGIVRSESFERVPYFLGFSKSTPNVCFQGTVDGGAKNCKALPLYATLGVPAATPDAAATADEVVNAFTTGGATASIGNYFKPLLSLQGMSDDAVRAKIAEAINSSPKTFRNVFLPDGRPARNYPFLRTQHINPQSADPQGRPSIHRDGWENYDLNISIPAPPSVFDVKNELKFLMDDMASLPGSVGTNPQLNFTNPMCHDDRIYHNDPDQARVYEAYAMVLAPGIEKYDGNLVKYCDFGKVFSFDGEMFRSQEQDAVAPIVESRPTIVGFVKVNVFDLNFQLLRTRPEGVVDPRNSRVSQTRNTPVFLNGNGALYDGNPYGLNLSGSSGFNDMYNNSKDFQDEYRKYDDCKKHDNCNKPEPKFQFERFVIPDNLRDCFDFGPFDSLLGAMQNISHSGNPLEAIQALVQLLERPILSLPDKHCLPRLRDGYYDKNDPNSYEPIRDLLPGVGCGALRARLDCATKDTLIPSGKDYRQNNPTLISPDAA